MSEPTAASSSAHRPGGGLARPGAGRRDITRWALDDLRPTQMTVGWREVAEKRRRWRALPTADTWTRPVPAVVGPGGAGFVLDRHHTLCALQAEGVGHVPVSILARLDHLSRADFWAAMRARNWCHPVDEDGRATSCSAIPDRFDRLADDPFRSLAAALRRRGAFGKTQGPYSEFRWADYLRRHLCVEAVRHDFDAALRAAEVLAKAAAARRLPGARMTETLPFPAASQTP